MKDTYCVLGTDCAASLSGQLQLRRYIGILAQILGPKRSAVLSLFSRCGRPLLDAERLRSLSRLVDRPRQGWFEAVVVRSGGERA